MNISLFFIHLYIGGYIFVIHFVVHMLATYVHNLSLSLVKTMKQVGSNWHVPIGLSWHVAGSFFSPG